MNGYNNFRNTSVPNGIYGNNIPSQTMFHQSGFAPSPFLHPNYHHSFPYTGQPYLNGYQAFNGGNQLYNPLGNDHPMQQQLFQNPLQPAKQKESMNGYKPYTNPYPKSHFNTKPPGTGMNSIMNSFKSQDGSIDFNKMVNTAGQMMSAVNQVSTMIKGIGGIFKT
ncbi:YppG family protein [Bacillus sp. FJAT-49736]|uniref:YppG family protein n=1 Tax=Bacillus sp. FJAT-49736 TaxID=2833582 RepID=UPI0020163DEB|nr:YppG family protein [Bacillus sp. FJAT-49736]